MFISEIGSFFSMTTLPARRPKILGRAVAPLAVRNGLPPSLLRRECPLRYGRFDSREELELHIDSSEFEKQHGVVIEPPLLPFNEFLEDGSPEALVRLLLKDDLLVARAVEAIGDEPTNALLLHENCAFDASLAPPCKKRMRFLGSWPKPERR